MELALPDSVAIGNAAMECAARRDFVVALRLVDLSTRCELGLTNDSIRAGRFTAGGDWHRADCSVRDHPGR